MAAPTPVARQVPTNAKMDDGFSSKITLNNKPSIQFMEKTVQPPSLSTGAAIMTATMFNIRYRTKRPPQLIDLGNIVTKVTYDPDVLTDIISQLGAEQGITVKFPDASTLAIWGYLSDFKPDPLEEGKPGEATVEIVPTNWDKANQVEAAPVYTAGAGTH